MGLVEMMSGHVIDCKYRELSTVVRIFQVSSKLRERQNNQIGGKVT